LNFHQRLFFRFIQQLDRLLHQYPALFGHWLSGKNGLNNHCVSQAENDLPSRNSFRLADFSPERCADRNKSNNKSFFCADEQDCFLRSDFKIHQQSGSLDLGKGNIGQTELPILARV